MTLRVTFLSLQAPLSFLLPHNLYQWLWPSNPPALAYVYEHLLMLMSFSMLSMNASSRWWHAASTLKSAELFQLGVFMSGRNEEPTQRRMGWWALSLHYRYASFELTYLKLGIERWTDSIRWGPSRVKDVSTNHDLATISSFYRILSGVLILSWKERLACQFGTYDIGFGLLNVRPINHPKTTKVFNWSSGGVYRRQAVYRPRLTKQTYSVYVKTPKGRRKWHLSTNYNFTITR